MSFLSTLALSWIFHGCILLSAQLSANFFLWLHIPVIWITAIVFIMAYSNHLALSQIFSWHDSQVTWFQWGNCCTRYQNCVEHWQCYTDLEHCYKYIQNESDINVHFHSYKFDFPLSAWILYTWRSSPDYRSNEIWRLPKCLTNPWSNRSQRKLFGDVSVHACHQDAPSDLYAASSIPLERLCWR